MRPFIEAVYGLREHLSTELRNRRSAPRGPGADGFTASQAHRIEQSLRRILRRNQTLKPIAHWLLGKRYEAYLRVSELRMKVGARIAGSDSFRRASAVNPENLIWIFGIGRSGTTWLRDMMRDMSNHQTWDEPLVGKLFGEFYNGETVVNLSRADFIMGDPIRRGWMGSIRNFVLDGAQYSHPRLTPEDYLVIGEHNGSIGAPLLVEALPESRLILLVRDPRDVVASMMDAVRKGGWLHQWREKKGIWEQDALAEEDPNAYVRGWAEKYRREVGSAKQAYDLHEGRKVLLRYEDLRADTLKTMRFMYSALELPVNDEELERVVTTHSWENIPEKDKGKGKFTRKATPGGWEEDLTPKQARIVEETTAPLLREFYPV